MGTQINKKSNSPLVSHKKLWVGIGIIVVIFLLVTSRELYLSATGHGLNPLAHQGELQNNATSIDGVRMEGEPLEKVSPVSGNDLQVGPVRLDNSSYITNSLDEFVEQQETATSSSPANDTHDSSSFLQAFSIKNAISDPVKFLQSFGYSTKQSFVNNNRKTTLLKLIDSISRYFISYNKFPDLDPSQDYGDYAWIQEMVDKNEMSGVYQYVIKTIEPVAYCGTAQQTGYCYSTNEHDAIIYVRLEKPFESDVCGMNKGLFLLWSSADNKFGNVCLSQEPTTLSGFDYFILK